MIKQKDVILTLWLLRGGPMDPSRYVFVVFSYFLIFCRERYLCKFLILEGLSPQLFGLIFPCPTSKKMRVGVHRAPPQ